MFPSLNFGSLSVPTFFVWISLVYCFLLWLSVTKAKYEKFPINTTLNISLILMVFGFLGGRIVHILWEVPQFYISQPIFVFYFWKGGFVFFGGLIFAVFAAWSYLKYKKLNFYKWADFFTPIAALGYALGRIGCFLNGCCYGKSCDLPWAIAGIHPTQLYAAFGELFIFSFLIYLARRSNEKYKKPGTLFLIWLNLHGFNRFIMEMFRDDYRGDYLLNLSLAQWFSIFLIMLTSIVISKNAEVSKS